MTALEDQLDEDQVEAVEEAEKESKRSKTKYGDLIEANDG